MTTKADSKDTNVRTFIEPSSRKPVAIYSRWHATSVMKSIKHWRSALVNRVVLTARRSLPVYLA